MPDYSQPTSPRLGDDYASKDSITGSRDKTVLEEINSTIPKLPVYSTLASGITVVGSKKGTAFVDLAGTAIRVFTADGDSSYLSVALS